MQQRHLRQVLFIQVEIAKRLQRESPWAWKRKHLAWFFEHHLDRHPETTRYYYFLIVRLLARRLQKKVWVKEQKTDFDRHCRQI